MEAAKKTGFWTKHVDPASGVRGPDAVAVAVAVAATTTALERTYYFNMVLGRSFWELPEELRAQVQRPMLDVMREWDPEAAERKYGAAQQQEEAQDDDELRKKREVAVAKARLADEQAHAASSALTLQERMAVAAQKRKAAETQSDVHRVESKSASGTESSSEYLALVRQLQQSDQGTDSTGAKWLVR